MTRHRNAATSISHCVLCAHDAATTQPAFLTASFVPLSTRVNHSPLEYTIMNRVHYKLLGIRLEPSLLQRFFQQSDENESESLNMLTLGPETSFGDTLAVARAIQSKRNLIELSFEELANTRDGDIMAEAMFRSLRFRSSLKKLRFQACLTEAGFISIGEILQQHPYSSLETLQLIDLTARFGQDRLIVLTEGAIALARAIETNTSLKTLTMHVDRITVTGSVSLLNALANNSSLESICLSGLEMNSEVWVAMARVVGNNTALKKLELKNSFSSPVSTEGLDVTPIVAAFASNNTLKEVAFDCWNFDASSLNGIVHGLIRNETLETIRYRGNKLGSERISALCRLISGRKTRTLYLSNNDIGDEHMPTLCVALRQAEELKGLELSRNRIGDPGAQQLAEFLLTNHQLEELVMTQHVISDEGFIALGKALKSNTSLRRMSLETSDPQMSIIGIEALVNGVKDNRRLIQLDLSDEDHEWPRRITDELNIYLERNKVLTPLLKADLPLSLWPHALKRAGLCDLNSPDMLYALVKEKSDLFRSVPITRKRKRRRTR